MTILSVLEPQMIISRNAHQSVNILLIHHASRDIALTSHARGVVGRYRRRFSTLKVQARKTLYLLRIHTWHISTKYMSRLSKTRIWWTTVTIIQLRPDFAFKNDAPYLAIRDELWGIFLEILKEIWPRYIEGALCLSIALENRHQGFYI